MSQSSTVGILRFNNLQLFSSCLVHFNQAALQKARNSVYIILCCTLYYFEQLFHIISAPSVVNISVTYTLCILDTQTLENNPCGHPNFIVRKFMKCLFQAYYSICFYLNITPMALHVDVIADSNN